ncbi:hypothetical protein ACTXG6_32535 [Pseudonocardia sp. Cha107L01]|uniref:hypothetical protein n=1 Tax=Pseudonocardia sp. Cha107L01 TaxID=3457576 RepID=UPI00403EEA55
MAPKLLTDADWAAELLTLTGFDAVITNSTDRVLLLAGHSTWREREMRSWMVHPARAGAQALRIAISVEEAS